MGLARSTFYDAPSRPVDDAEIVGRMKAICGEFETNGCRRVGALRYQGVVVNSPCHSHSKKSFCHRPLESGHQILLWYRNPPGTGTGRSEIADNNGPSLWQPITRRKTYGA